MATEMLPTVAVAEMLKIQPVSVKHLCQAGKIPGARKRWSRWEIPAAWVRAEVRRRTKEAGTERTSPGRPFNLARNLGKPAK